METKKKLETSANVAIIIVALLFSVAIIKRYFFTPASVVEKRQSLIGSTLNLEGISLSNKERTLVFAISSTCHFCDESSDFYKRLLNETRSLNLSTLAVFPQNIPVGQIYVADHGLKFDDIKQVNFQTLNVKGTPTLILIDNKGKVLQEWEGKLSTDKESEVLALLKN